MLMNNGIYKAPFKKCLKRRMWISFILIIIGILTETFMFIGVTNRFLNFVNGHSKDFLKGFYTGTGGGLIAAGIITFIKSILLFKNKGKFKIAEIEYNDERNRFICDKTFSLTTIISLFLLLLAVIIFGLINFQVFITLLYVLGVYGGILLIIYLVMKMKY